MVALCEGILNTVYAYVRYNPSGSTAPNQSDTRIYSWVGRVNLLLGEEAEKHIHPIGDTLSRMNSDSNPGQIYTSFLLVCDVCACIMWGVKTIFGNIDCYVMICFSFTLSNFSDPFILLLLVSYPVIT